MRPDEALNWMLCYCSIEETKVKFTLDYYEFEIRIFDLPLIWSVNIHLIVYDDFFHRLHCSVTG